MSRPLRWPSRRIAAAALGLGLLFGSAVAGTVAATTSETLEDDFESESFGGSTGSLAWATPWIEAGEVDGPASGIIQVIVEPHCASLACLNLARASSGANGSVEREANLLAASSVSLSFDRKRHMHSSGGGGDVELAISDDGGSSWTPLKTWALDTTDAAPVPELFDISGFSAEDTRIRFEVTGSLDVSHLNVDNLVISATMEDPPPADWYLKGDGVPTASLGSLPVATILPNYDPGRDLQPGLLLEKSGLGLGETDPVKHQFWLTPPQWHALDGQQVNLVLWTAVRMFDSGIRGIVDAGLYDCAAGGSDCNLIAQGRLDLPDWSAGSPGWVEHTIDLGVVTHDMAADRALAVKVVVGNDSGDDLWFAYDTTSYPSRIAIGAPAPNRSPTLDPIPPQPATELVPLTFTATGSDPDLGDTLAFSLVDGTDPVPAGASIGPTNGQFTWTPTETEGPGTYGFKVRISDDGSPSLSDDQEVTFSVAEVNQAPTLDPIGPQSGDEETAINFTAAASDGDLPANGLLFSLSGAVPGGAAIDPVSGAFSWTPTEAQGPGAFVFDVVVADDGTPPLNDAETITVTVAETNVAPVPDAIPAQSVDESTPLAITATATDGDLPADGLGWTLVSGPGSVTPGGDYSWTPGEADGPGVHPVTLRVSDDGTPAMWADVGFTITVGEVNIDPSLTAPGSQASGEGDTVSLFVAAGDPDVPANTLTWSALGLPAGLTIDPDTGEISGTVQAGAAAGSPYASQVSVDDGGVPLGTDMVTFSWTVTANNLSPTLDPVGPQSGPEGAAITFAASASDPNPADSLAFSLGGTVPAGAAIHPATGAFTWTPTEAHGPGTYVFDVVVTDNGTPPLATAETITVTVTEANLPPALAAIGPQSGAEATAIAFTATATDPDLPANALSYSLAGAVPAGAAIHPATGAFTWTPTEAHGPGTYVFDVVVTDNGTPPLATAETITVTVTEANLPPALAAIGPQSGAEATTITFTATATDPDLPANALSYSLAGGVPAGAAIHPATGAFTWTPTEVQGPGTYVFDVVVTDNGSPVLSDRETITVTVTEANLPPSLAAIGPQSGAEATTITFTATATDPDLPANALSYSLAGAVPAGAAIHPATGAFTWTPTEAHGPGTYVFDVVATDNGTPPLATAETITVTVTEANTAPAVTSPGDQSNGEGDAVSLYVAAADQDLPADILTWAAGGLPPGLAIDPATGEVAGTIDAAAAAGSPYAVTVTVADDGSPPAFGTAAFTWVVTDTNRSPAVDPIGPIGGDEGDLIAFTAAATDPDGDRITFSVAGAPLGAAVDPATGGFTWTPTEAQGPGVYTLDVIATDDGTPPLAAAESVTVTVGEVNAAPTLAALSPIVVDEGSPIAVIADGEDTDLPANALTYGLTAAPAGAAIDPVTGAISWSPGEDDGPAAHAFDVMVTDDGSPPLSATATLTVTVAEVNQPPVLAPITPPAAVEGQQATFVAVATDADLPANTVTYSLANAPPGAGIDPGSGAFTWTPGEADGPGIFTFDVVATDDGSPALHSTRTVTMRVAEANQAPVLHMIGDHEGPEGAELAFTAAASDADEPSGTPAFSLAGAVPAGATIDATDGAFAWTPTEGQGPGAYTFDVVVTDDGAPPLSDSERITITVTEVPTPPVLAPIGPVSGSEGTPIEFLATAADPDEPAADLDFRLDGPVPVGASITADGQFSWVPREIQGPGSYAFVVVVTDGLLSDSETVAVTVGEHNARPTLEPIEAIAVAEGDIVTIDATAGDRDHPANTLSFSLAGDVPAGARIDSATGAFTWQTGEADGPADHTFEVVVTDDGSPVKSHRTTVAVVVAEVNSPPLLDPIPDQMGVVGEELTFQAMASDHDLPPGVLDFGLDGVVPDSATITGNGSFHWTPATEGTYAFDVTVTDRGVPPLQASATVTLSVAAAPPPPATGGGIAPPQTVPPPTPPADPPAIAQAATTGPPPEPSPIPPPPPEPYLDPPEAPTPAAAATATEVDPADGADPETLARRRALVTAVGELTDPAREQATDRGVRRTLVLMARAGLGTLDSLSQPMGLLLVAIALAATVGRIGLVPVSRRKRTGTGTVQWFDEAAGYGLILPDGSDDQVFAHLSVVRRSDRRRILPGRRVSYGIMRGPRRAIATRVRLSDRGDR